MEDKIRRSFAIIGTLVVAVTFVGVTVLALYAYSRCEGLTGPEVRDSFFWGCIGAAAATFGCLVVYLLTLVFRLMVDPSTMD